MAFTYTGDPANNDIDYLRFTIGDTVESSVMLHDAELQYIIDNNTAVNKRIALAFRYAATALGAKAVKRSLGPQSEDASGRLKYFAAQADKYEKLGSFSGVPPTPTYQDDLVFEKGMMANE